MREWLASGEIGRLHAIRLISDWWGADHRGAHPGRGLRFLSHDGSIIVGEGIHFADLARWLGGSDFDFARLHCVGACVRHGPLPDHMVLTGVLQNGVVVNIENSHAYGAASKEGVMDRQADLIGDGGVIKWWEIQRVLKLYGRTRSATVEGGEDKQFPEMYRDFIASVRAGRVTPTLPTLEDGVKALAVVLAAHHAVQG